MILAREKHYSIDCVYICRDLPIRKRNAELGFWCSLRLADILVPNLRIGDDVIREQVHALRRLQVDHCDAVVAQPLHTALKIDALAHDERADVELAHQATAVPAWRQRGHHDGVTVAALPPSLAERVCLRVHRRVVLLHSPIVTAPQQIPLPVEHCCPNWNAALCQTQARLRYGDVQHRLVVLHLHHRNNRSEAGTHFSSRKI